MTKQRVDIRKFNKIVLLYNRNSGKQLFATMLTRVNEIYKYIKSVVGSKKIELLNIDDFAKLPTLTDNIAQQNVDWVIIAGGDGTIRSVIEQFADKNYRPYVSVFPAGTVNLVAKEFNLSSDPGKWVKRMLKGVIEPVYLGRTNGRVFLTVTGIGFDSLVVDNVSEIEKKLLSKFAYVWQGTELMRKELLFSNWRYKFMVRMDDEDQWHEASSVIVGKSRYYAGRYSLFRGAALTSPLLHVALFTGNKRSDFVRYAACIALESLQLDKSILVKQARKIEIICNEADFAAELDGDALTKAPLHIKIEDEVVNFLA